MYGACEDRRLGHTAQGQQPQQQTTVVPGYAAGMAGVATESFAGLVGSLFEDHSKCWPVCLSVSVPTVGHAVCCVDEANNQQLLSAKAQLRAILSNRLFLSLTLSLCGLYFVVTGIQFWITDYLTTPVSEGGIGSLYRGLGGSSA